MVCNEKLNSAAIKAKEGCKASLEEIIRFFLPMINSMAEKVWYKMPDESSLRFECYRSLKSSIGTYDAEKGDFYQYATRNLIKKRNDHLKRRKTLWKMQHPLETGGEDHEPINFIQDVLADVENSVLLNEKVALLAQGDKRRMAILNQWMRGCTNASDLARYLADTFGGSPEKHRVEIHRFKTRCTKVLA